MTISWAPINDRFGAEVDIDLNTELTPAIAEQFGELFDEQGMLVFRRQNIDYATQQKVVSIVGNPLTEVKYVSSKHDPSGDPLAEPADPDFRTVMFHSDYVFLPELPLNGISLYGEEVEAATGNRRVQGTRFLSARNGYLDLPEDARVELEGRTARHLHALTMSADEQRALKDKPFEEVAGLATFTSEHPLFLTHPRSGKTILLYIPWFTHSIDSYSPEESKKWFALFDELLYREENIYTHRWEQGDLVIWDNLAMQHSKETVEASDGPLPTRVLRRSAFGPAERNIYGHSAFESVSSTRWVGHQLERLVG